ncbi:MAG: DUF2306 domain-containing protein [Pyrinomonadaceae bacterium]
MDNLEQGAIATDPKYIRPWWRSSTVALLSAALLSSAAAWWLIAWPVASVANVEKHPDHFGLVFAHMIGGTIMLFVGAVNLYIGTTNKYFRYHKLFGRIYLIGGSLGVAFVVIVLLSTAHKSEAGGIFTNMTISLLTLAAAWLTCAAMAYRAVRNHHYELHRDWIIRSYVLAWSFVFCRLASRVPSVESLGGGEAFIWLSWIGPLLICEVLLHWRAGGKNPVRIG